MNLNYINMLSGIFTALGTVLACVISLVLSYNANKIKAKAIISMYVPYLANQGKIVYSDQDQILLIEVTNIGTKPFSVAKFVIKNTLKNKYYTTVPDYNHSICTKPDTIFQESSQGKYVFPFKPFAKSMLESLEIKPKDVINMNQINKIQILIITNLGQHIKVKYIETFLDEIKDDLKNIIN